MDALSEQARAVVVDVDDAALTVMSVSGPADHTVVFDALA
jgi:hypothetical protein